MNLFKRRRLEDYARSLARYLPNDRTFASKNVRDSNLRKILRGLAGEMFVINGVLIDYVDESFARTTELFLDRWERDLGIPDSCFTGDGTIDERRRDVIIKLSLMNVQVEEDFILLAQALGAQIRIEQGAQSGVFPVQLPHRFFPSAEDARFTMIVVASDDTNAELVECVLREVRPANVVLIFLIDE